MTKNIVLDCFGVRCVPPFSEKEPNFQNGQKSQENRTNMDLILLFSAKPLDKHGITLVHITYPPLLFRGAVIRRWTFISKFKNLRVVF